MVKLEAEEQQNGSKQEAELGCGVDQVVDLDFGATKVVSCLIEGYLFLKISVWTLDCEETCPDMADGLHPLSTLDAAELDFLVENGLEFNQIGRQEVTHIY